MAVAELLEWKELKKLAQKEQIWKMGECLVRMSRRLGEGCEGCELCMWAQRLELQPCPWLKNRSLLHVLHGPSMALG